MKTARSGSFGLLWIAQVHLLLSVQGYAWVAFPISSHGSEVARRALLLSPRIRKFRCSSPIGPRRRSSWLYLNGVVTDTDTETSRICDIRCRNIAGFVGSASGGESPLDEIRIDLEAADLLRQRQHSSHRLVVVTGESGAGKSLLLRRSLELLSGGKVAPGLVSPTTGTTSRKGDSTVLSVEMNLLLREPQLSATRSALTNLGLDPTLLPSDGQFHVERLVQYTAPPDPSSSTSAPPKRLKSLCKVNERVVTLRALEGLVKPLVALVDSSTAAQALAKPEARLATLDTAVPALHRQRVQTAQRHYRAARQRREQLESELRNRVLPSSFSNNPNSEQDLELLQHWVDELDSFEHRVLQLCSTLVTPESSRSSSSSSLASLSQTLANTAWNERAPTSSGPQASVLWERMNAYRSAVANRERQLAAAQAAVEFMGSLSSAQSAVTAVERTRDRLVEATTYGRESGLDATELPSPVLRASERAHDLLNVIEELIAEFVECVDGEDNGLIRLLECEVRSGASSKENLDAVLLEWGTLSRKHGIAASLLPFCHGSLRAELDGNVEAQTLLPQAKEEEAVALAAFEEACATLSQERLVVARQLSEAVTSLLPSLGMDQAVFTARVNPRARKCTDAAAYTGAASIGLDSVDFVLDQSSAAASRGGTGAQQGPVHAVASSGEKARLLLSIECALPGSVGAACATFLSAADGSTLYDTVPPVAVLYDEIDAHVGGHAAVALARMMVKQSVAGSQVIAITHNPSVAASGDLHLVVKRQTLSDDSRTGSATIVSVDAVGGAERRRELARMASGDLAAEEAEIFAEALIRDGSKR